MNTPNVKCICSGTCHPHDRTTQLVKMSLLALPAKSLVVPAEVEMHMWAMGIRR